MNAIPYERTPSTSALLSMASVAEPAVASPQRLHRACPAQISLVRGNAAAQSAATASAISWSWRQRQQKSRHEWPECEDQAPQSVPILEFNVELVLIQISPTACWFDKPSRILAVGTSTLSVAFIVSSQRPCRDRSMRLQSIHSSVADAGAGSAAAACASAPDERAGRSGSPCTGC